MGVRYKTFGLGPYEAVKDETPHGSSLRRRYYELKEVSLSDEGIDWLDAVASSVQGIVGVGRSILVGAHFYIVIEDDADIESVDQRFYRALRRRKLNDEQFSRYTGGATIFTSEIDWDLVRKYEAVSAESASGLVPSRFGYADG